MTVTVTVSPRTKLIIMIIMIIMMMMLVKQSRPRGHCFRHGDDHSGWQCPVTGYGESMTNLNGFAFAVIPQHFQRHLEFRNAQMIAPDTTQSIEAS
jgi:hypothetical protein